MNRLKELLIAVLRGFLRWAATVSLKNFAISEKLTRQDRIYGKYKSQKRKFREKAISKSNHFRTASNQLQIKTRFCSVMPNLFSTNDVRRSPQKMDCHNQIQCTNKRASIKVNLQRYLLTFTFNGKLRGEPLRNYEDSLWNGSMKTSSRENFKICKGVF